MKTRIDCAYLFSKNIKQFFFINEKLFFQMLSTEINADSFDSIQLRKRRNFWHEIFLDPKLPLQPSRMFFVARQLYFKKEFVREWIEKKANITLTFNCRFLLFSNHVFIQVLLHTYPVFLFCFCNLYFFLTFFCFYLWLFAHSNSARWEKHVYKSMRIFVCFYSDQRFICNFTPDVTSF